MRRVLAPLLVLLAALPAAAELPPEWRSWNEPVEPFRIAGNLYYVGAREVAAYLFATPDGLILIDGGFEETVPVIEAAIETLGFRVEEVRVLLSTHAHFDHVGGLAELARLTGATVVASSAEAPLLEMGGEEYPFPPVPVDRVIEDGDTVELGGTTLTAMVTPGHTPGCTNWRTTVEGLSAIVLCSVSVLPEMDLVSVDAFPEGAPSCAGERLDALDLISSWPTTARSSTSWKRWSACAAGQGGQQHRGPGSLPPAPRGEAEGPRGGVGSAALGEVTLRRDILGFLARYRGSIARAAVGRLARGLPSAGRERGVCPGASRVRDRRASSASRVTPSAPRRCAGWRGASSTGAPTAPA
ncbi:MAG: metallo-beta-lactamase [Thermoanaerobaculia bacterium]